NPNISDLLKLEFADLYIVNNSVPSGLEFRYVSGFDFISSPLGKFNAETRLNIVKPIITEEFVQTLESLKNIVIHKGNLEPFRAAVNSTVARSEAIYTVGVPPDVNIIVGLYKYLKHLGNVKQDELFNRLFSQWQDASLESERLLKMAGEKLRSEERRVGKE